MGLSNNPPGLPHKSRQRIHLADVAKPGHKAIADATAVLA
jgi:hypothetical protein